MDATIAELEHDNPLIERIDILVAREQMAGAHDEFLASVVWALRFTI